MICLRVSEKVANERRRKLLKEAHQKGRTPSNIHRARCDWTLLATNVPETDLAVETAWRLYSFRFYGRLAFFAMQETAQNPDRARKIGLRHDDVVVPERRNRDGAYAGFVQKRSYRREVAA